MTETTEQLPEDLSSYESLDLYEVLALDPDNARDITSGQIKKAYRLKALKCHPDKAKTDAERAEFHIAFQTVALAYSVLGDEGRRKRYDANGSVEDALRDGPDGEDAASMREFFADLWKSGSITVELIEKDKQVYRSSGEERADVLKYYKQGKGKMDVVMESVLHTTSNPDDNTDENGLDDEARIRKIIEEAIETGEVKLYAAFKKKESGKEKARRGKAAQKEAEEAEELGKKLGLDKLHKKKSVIKGGAESDEDALRALIQSRGQKRMSSLIDNLETKYGASSKGGSSKKRRKASEVLDPEAEAASGPTEDEFIRIQAEMEENRRTNKKSSKIKAKTRTTRSGRK